MLMMGMKGEGGSNDWCDRYNRRCDCIRIHDVMRDEAHLLYSPGGDVGVGDGEKDGVGARFRDSDSDGTVMGAGAGDGEGDGESGDRDAWM